MWDVARYSTNAVTSTSVFENAAARGAPLSNTVAGK